MCTTRALEEQLGQFSKKSDQWSRTRCDKEKKFTDGWTDPSVHGVGLTPAQHHGRMDAGWSQYGLANGRAKQ